ncbi:heme-binding protein [Vibrio parahaemolyticus]|uniref:Heme-binding protein n=1 Tax=Vibrio parahaemolyticus TaxID=670 RepID=A0A7Z2MZP2_VIBPH|nr:heme-binding protein [Vibrio parahaemolyticus]EGR1577999.1 heme-binding protein [Vibrio parahaemolyticus]EHE7896280.1 heme-binding protein [Vibrio parahaemolyticus]MBE3865486.1 heme-binding protein [Vibrio parahaemolyticus]MRD93796.1 heme-binding protein [Vibrio parahaemolyticus]
MSLNLAKQITAIAIQQAKKQEFNICVSVVDQAGLLVHFERMDNALLGAIDVAIKKARTAALFQTNSAELGAIAQPGGAIYTLEATNGGLISFGGGVILRNEQGNVIGAIGVAGATVEADEAIAQLAARQ